jgi:hypothetical protein
LLITLTGRHAGISAANGYAFIVFTKLSGTTITVATTTVEALSLIRAELIGFAAIAANTTVDALVGFANGSQRTVIMLTTANLTVASDADHALAANRILRTRHNTSSLDTDHGRAALIIVLTGTFLTRTASGEKKHRKKDDLRPIARRHEGSGLRHLRLSTSRSIFHLKLSILTDFAGLNSP